MRKRRQESDGAVVAGKRVMTVERRVPACMAFQTETAECDWPARPITRKGERPCIQKVIMVGATHLARPWEKLAATARTLDVTAYGAKPTAADIFRAVDGFEFINTRFSLHAKTAK